jgi:hypothetical protein
MLFVQVRLQSPITRPPLVIGTYQSWVSGTFSDTARLSLSAAKGDRMGKGKNSANKDDDSSDAGSVYLEDQVTR